MFLNNLISIFVSIIEFVNSDLLIFLTYGITAFGAIVSLASRVS